MVQRLSQECDIDDKSRFIDKEYLKTHYAICDQCGINIEVINGLNQSAM